MYEKAIFHSSKTSNFFYRNSAAMWELKLSYFTHTITTERAKRVLMIANTEKKNLKEHVLTLSRRHTFV